MPKQKKLTPKELYWAKKNKEEQERAAYPPPGLINHGNTCFMNSVMQGLFATDLLRRTVEFQPSTGDGSNNTDSRFIIPSPSRSPLLTNGRGPKDVQQDWCEGLPVGDIFIRTLERAWTMRDKKDRTSLSPKELLNALGKKYDQYLDFRQQDAHEFFIHLLDCMRMEEIDIIKKRQPPLPKASAQGRPDTNIPTGDKQTPLQPISEEERLIPFVDMIWGGRFTSYLICTTCKHVSHTYEDFDGLSLPIRQDETKERKRDRLRAFASKFIATSGGGVHQWHTGLLPRAQSQPPSPRLTSKGLERKLELGDIPETTRRRSFESTVGSLSISNVDDEIPEKVIEEDGSLSVEKAKEKILEEISNVVAPIASFDTTNPASGTSTPDLSDVPDKLAAAGAAIPYHSLVPSSASTSTRTLPVVSSVASGTQWSKKVGGRISRRISITMSKGGKLGEMMKTAKDRMEKSDSEANGGVAAALEKLTGKSAPVSEDASTEASTSKLQLSNAAPSTSETKTKRRSALLLHNRLRERETRQKANAPASDREALEAAYLTRILQDAPAANPVPLQLLTAPNSSESLARAGSASSTGSGSGSGMHSFMAQLSRLNIGVANQTVEECLRTFTAVEALDGENMFGCHRCWKIAHGKMSVSARRRASNDDSSDEEEKKNDTPLDKPPTPQAVVIPRRPFALSETGRANTSSSIASVSSVPSTTSTKSTVFAPDSDGVVMSGNRELEDSIQLTIKRPSTPVKTRTPSEDSTVYNTSSTSLDTSSVKSDALTICTSPGSAVEYKGSETTALGLLTPEIPTIAMTMSSPVSPDDAQRDVRGITIPLLNGILPDENNVLRPPQRSFRSSGQIKDGFSSEGTTSPSSEDEQGEISNISDASSVPPPGLNGTTNNNSSPRRSRSSVIPRSKQVIYRRALKRYLISDPPPILVIHLKRFQQVSKSSLTLFGNLKKLDDYVSFPEYLDLRPFLAPRKEDYGLGRGEVEGNVADKGSRMEDKPCIFRLYAVIVHIGNLLGGHYVAYTALPPNDPILPQTQDTEKDKDGKDKSSKASEPGKRNEPQSSRHASRQWCYISDTEVRLVGLDEVLKAKAYLCMYERLVD